MFFKFGKYGALYKRWFKVIMKKLIFIFSTVVLLTGCVEIKTTNPNEVYQYWAGAAPTKDLQLINGQYWQSASLTKEYVMYLKLKPTEKWWDEFLTQNQLQNDDDVWIIPADAPAWFNPSDKLVRYRSNDGFDQGSRYFRDARTNECFIYEIQL